MSPKCTLLNFYEQAFPLISFHPQILGQSCFWSKMWESLLKAISNQREDNLFLAVTHLVQFTSVAQSCLTLCDPMNCNMPGFAVHYQLLEFTQTHVHWAGNAIQPSPPLSSPSPPTFNLSQLLGLFKWVSSSHQVAKVLEFQLQHQSFHWIFKTDFL